MNDNELLELLAEAEHDQVETSIAQILTALLAEYPGDWIAGQQIPSGDDFTNAKKVLLGQELIVVTSWGTKPWTLTTRGKRVAEAYASASSAHGKFRRAAVQRALLKQVHHFSNSSQKPPTNAIIGLPVGGAEVTSAEHDEAVRQLVEFDFLRGTPQDDGGLYRPLITTAGLRAADDSRSPEDFHFDQDSRGITMNTGDINTNINHGNQGVTAVGKDIEQTDNTVSFGERAEEAREKIAEIKALVGEIEDVPPVIESRLLELEAVSADPQVDRTKLQEAISSFQNSIMEKFADAAWVGVAGATASLPSVLGMFGS